jgi:hypothetical protein
MTAARKVGGSTPSRRATSGNVAAADAQRRKVGGGCLKVWLGFEIEVDPAIAALMAERSVRVPYL